MIRTNVQQRPSWRERFEEMGFSFHSLDGLYWREGTGYEFSAREIDVLEETTASLHDMCLNAVEHVVRNNLYARLAIPADFGALIKRSWERKTPSLYGRFDLAYDGQKAPKLLEYNADTPTSLFESSIAQWIWLQDLFPDCDQFNSIHEKLSEVFASIRQGLPIGSPLYFTCVRDHQEDLLTVEYLRDVAIQTGIDGRHIFIEDIGYSPEAGRFCDLEDQAIDSLFKLYPWEWLAVEEFGRYLLAEPIGLILEPAWKMVLANKGILPILWELYPNHPNLLPASFEPLRQARPQVKKPLLSREGANISIFSGNATEAATGGSYGKEGHIYQDYCELPRFNDSYAVIGSWVIGGQPAGIGIREDSTPITKNSSTFVPHLFKP